MNSFDARRASIRRQMQSMSQAGITTATTKRRSNSRSKSPMPPSFSSGPNMDAARRFLFEENDEDFCKTPTASNRTLGRGHGALTKSHSNKDHTKGVWASLKNSVKSLGRGDTRSVGRNANLHNLNPDLEYRPSIWTRASNSFRRGLAGCTLSNGSGSNGLRSRYEMATSNGRGKKCFLVLFALLAIVLPFVLFVSKSSENKQGLAPAQRYDAISRRIIDAGISLDIDLNTEATPQKEALEWITNGDRAQLPVDDEFLLQRYSLAVFYFATHGDNMYQSVTVNLTKTVPAKVAQDEEPEAQEVRGQAPEEVLAEELNDLPDEGAMGDDLAALPDWIDEQNWLSEQGYCSWYGIVCHHRRGTSAKITTYDGNNGISLLNMTENNVRGWIPREVFIANPDIRWFSVSGNGLFGTVPTEVGLLDQLRYLSFASNFFTGWLPSEIVKLTSLNALYIDGNYMAGSLPNSIGQLSNLEALSIYDNMFTGTISSEIGDNMQRLTSLYMDANYFTGGIPTSLGRLRKLADLRLRQNSLFGTIPTELGELNDLEVLYIDRNDLTGTIPSELGLVGKYLEELHLHINHLTGTLPTELANLRNAGSIYLDNNRLKGAIPTQFGAMYDLEELYLHKNILSGTIPTEIGKMSNLYNFQAYTNGLTGTIPTEIARAWKLEHLYLQDNLLKGTFPIEVAELTKMQKLRLYWNDIKGVVPEKVCDLMEYGLVEFKVDCAGDVPQLDCTCCTHCYT